MELFGFFISLEIVTPFIHLAVAAFLGMVLGLERVYARKIAGIRTYGLVSVGSALFVVVSTLVVDQFIGLTNYDPLRVAAQIVVGIGFLGAGTIFRDHAHVEGLTTAAGLWVAAGVGMAAGFGLYGIATFATAITLFIFSAKWTLERKVKRALGKWDENETES